MYLKKPTCKAAKKQNDTVAWHLRSLQSISIEKIKMLEYGV